jgi:hypothetical protein
MKDLRQFIKTKIREFLNESYSPTERIEYDGYYVGDIIVSDGNEPYTGGNVFPIKGEKYQLVQKDLSDFNYTRQDLYDNDKGYEKEQDIWIEKMKQNFLETPPIPEEDDGLHRIISAKELGYKTILMWKKI